MDRNQEGSKSTLTGIVCTDTKHIFFQFLNKEYEYIIRQN